jgi:hypothetical protein
VIGGSSAAQVGSGSRQADDRVMEGSGESTRHSASGAPSQQLAFMWQCGHSHRVAIGSNSTPQ